MFPETAPSANPVFFRTYSRRKDTGRESWEEASTRALSGLTQLGKFTDQETALVKSQLDELKTLPSGRWLWVGGTEWINNPTNFSGAYNCTSTDVVDWEAFSLQMDLTMVGAGTGAVLEKNLISRLPAIETKLDVFVGGNIGTHVGPRQQITTVEAMRHPARIVIGDTRQGWTHGVRALLRLASTKRLGGVQRVEIDLSNVRPPGEPLKGFGGVSNPIRLETLYKRVGAILSGAVGRQLTAVECCKILDECSLTVVAGNIRRSAGMRQFSSDDAEAAVAKDNLWICDSEGNWSIDPDRDCLRMSNHTRVFHRKPTIEEVTESVTKQFWSGEGAIQYAPEAIARASGDVLCKRSEKESFMEVYEQDRDAAMELLAIRGADHLEHRLGRYGLNPCGEIIGRDFHCNLAEVHLNQLDPNDPQDQERAFKAAALIAAALLHHKFAVDRYQHSREIDPIVGVSFTGLFDYCVHAFGVPWLNWFADGRPHDDRGDHYRSLEAAQLERWKWIVEKTVTEYCERHGLRVPNRTTTVQPAGTKSLLTGASSGWHPPKAARFIRRITFQKNDPVAQACIAYGYSVIPGVSSKDDLGKLLDDPHDERVSEWLVEIPTEVSWANLPGADKVDLSRLTATAQLDFYMQVQRYYTTHNTSATIEFREEEIPALSAAITSACGEGFISAALLARFDANETFPRLPFEPISKKKYQTLLEGVQSRQITSDFHLALSAYDQPSEALAGPAQCDSDKCLFEDKGPE